MPRPDVRWTECPGRKGDRLGASRLSDRRPTIREVAVRAGVSIGTVSNVLTGRRNVSAGRREAILEAIEALGYVPDVAARSLISRRVRSRPPADPATPRLTCIGYVCADHTAQVNVLPHRDDRVTAMAIDPERARAGAAHARWLGQDALQSRTDGQTNAPTASRPGRSVSLDARQP